MSPSPEATAIHAPLDLIAQIYAASSKEQATDDSFFDAVSEHFSTVLKDQKHAIPTLERTHHRGRLVRFRCMVQDTGLANEVYALDVGGDGGRGCCAYSEGAASGSPILGYDSQDYSKLRERQVIYATSVPGETEWYSKSLEKPTSSDKVGVPDDVGSSLSAELAERLNVTPASTYVQPASLASKYPLAGQKHTGAIVKLYPSSMNADQANVKSTEVVEFVGVLDYSAFPTASADEAEQHGAASSNQDLVKTLHAIYRVEDEPVNADSSSSTDFASAREALIDYLASGLSGDTLAAEWLLLSLFGKIYTRRGALALGQLPLNLSFPSSSASAAPAALQSLLESLLPRLVPTRFTVDALNASSYVPRSKDENLISGLLQLPEETTLLVDETMMGEGTLKDAGVRNVQALATVINDQTLAYVFPYSSFTFQTDLKVIVLSKGKSLIPIECVVPVVPSRSSETTPSPSPENLATWRAMLRYTPGSDFNIPDDVSEYIQSDFVASRQNKSVTQEDLVRRMTMARLLACSHSKTVLDKETWERTRELDEARKRRV